MKTLNKFILILIISVGSLSASAQVYDGITQPTDFRAWMPVFFKIDPPGHSQPNASPFVAVKQTVNNWFSVTEVLRYNIGQNNVQPQIWLNFNINKKVWFLARTGYNSIDGSWFETLSGTWKMPKSFMLDFTYNMYNTKTAFTKGVAQVLIGYRYKNLFVLNAGYQVLDKQGEAGFITNLRLMVYKNYGWVQLRYDSSSKMFAISTVVQVNYRNNQ